jgi:hypothetical protein
LVEALAIIPVSVAQALVLAEQALLSVAQALVLAEQVSMSVSVALDKSTAPLLIWRFLRRCLRQ